MNVPHPWPVNSAPVANLNPAAAPAPSQSAANASLPVVPIPAFQPVYAAMGAAARVQPQIVRIEGMDVSLNIILYM